MRACVATNSLLEPPTDAVAHLRLHPPQPLLGLGQLQATRLDQLCVHGAVDLRIALQRDLRRLQLRDDAREALLEHRDVLRQRCP
eukprot:scaffold67542_cov63-Phaeocystis_antarctica.AAC.9